MTERRQLVGDAAVAVLAEHGLRGLTHRAVDAAAGLPPGSTSNIFRTRAALVAGVVDRLAALDLTVLPQFCAPGGEAGDVPGDLGLDDLAALLTSATVALSTPPMDRLTRARMMLAFDESADLAPQHRGLIVVLMGALSELGHPAPGPTARAVVDYVDGTIFHALTLDTRTVDPAEVSTAIRRLLGAGPQPDTSPQADA